MNIINDIRAKQNQLITLINTIFDGIEKDLKNLKDEEIEESNIYDSVHPITNTYGFKGIKPIAVIIGGEYMIAPTWKVVVKNVLNEVMKEPRMTIRLLLLRDRLLGRVRKRISSEPDEMRSPLKLRKDLYIETHYDTKTLMDFLLQILDEIHYNYSNITIVTKR